eukprot:3881480-Rhodomonas_salina.1
MPCGPMIAPVSPSLFPASSSSSVFVAFASSPAPFHQDSKWTAVRHACPKESAKCNRRGSASSPPEAPHAFLLSLSCSAPSASAPSEAAPAEASVASPAADQSALRNMHNRTVGKWLRGGKSKVAAEFEGEEEREMVLCAPPPTRYFRKRKTSTQRA